LADSAAPTRLTLDFFQHFRDHVTRDPDRIAFQILYPGGKEEYSFGRTASEVLAVADYLATREIREGDRVGLLFENHPRWGIGFLAVQCVGAIAVPLDILHRAETLARLLDHSGCRFILSSGKQLQLLEEVQHLLPSPLPALIHGSTGGKYPEWEAVVADRRTDWNRLPMVRRDPDLPHLIMYTSGTTGDPKGVVLTGRNLYRNVVEALGMIRISPDDHFLGVLPLYHILALQINFIAPLYAGARSSFLDALDAQRILKAFREEGISVFVCVPQFYYLLHRRILAEVEKRGWAARRAFRMLLKVSRLGWRYTGKRFGRYLFRSVHAPFGPALRLFGVGGARFDPEVARELTDLGFTVVQAYGMTETAALATLTDLRPSSIGSAGTPLPHVEIRIDRPDAEGIGEVLIRGDNVMQGYYRNPEATAEALAGGWLHSGDLGRLDRRGQLYITGRAKDVIVLSSGKNIYPEEVEHFYQSQCPLIREICVLGIPEPGSDQERLHAVVVPDFDRLKQERMVNAYDMIRYLMETLSQRLPSYQRVHSLELWQEPLPRTTTRKIRRFEVLERVLRGKTEPAVGRAAPWQPSDAVEKSLLQLLLQTKQQANVHPDANLELDLGVDSLERVEFLSSIKENLGVEIPDEVGGEFLTFGDVVQYVRERLSAELEGGAERKSWKEILEEPLSAADQAELGDRLRRRRFWEYLFVLTALAVRLLAKLLFRLRGEGLEYLPKEYPFLVCPNHQSYLDAFLVTSILPVRAARRFSALAYSDYIDGFWTAFLGRMIRTIPVDADRNLRRALKLAAEALRRELVLVVFPEGERSIDGKLKAFRKGPAILATVLGIPVVPAGIRGAYEVWPRGSNRIRLHPIRIRFGPPLKPQPGESPEAFNHRLREAVQELL
jgi:long-chain acyl-CoA synthetase